MAELIIDSNIQIDNNQDIIKEENDQEITPWKVNSKNGINYMKLINQFGSNPIDGEIIKRIERTTNMRAHIWLRRGR